MDKKLVKIEILEVNITKAKEEEILEYILERLKTRDKKLFITTPNPEIIMYANKHPEFRAILNEADLALPDGVGVLMASKLMGKGIEARVTGTDMVEKLSARLSKRTDTAGFLGGLGTVAEIASKRLQEKYPSLKIAYASSEWDLKLLKTEWIDVLFVAFGFPKQEEWIYENLPKLPVTVAIGVGGAFDFVSGKVGRAPKFVQNIGLEWLYRLVKQPWRIKRQAALPKFTYLVLKEALKSHSRGDVQK